jgi:protein phosphatase PTC7
VLAVADGVGGWAEMGIDPGLYSKELCRHIKSGVEKNETKYVANPK